LYPAEHGGIQGDMEKSGMERLTYATGLPVRT
jgi:hypothetical protein